jgi:transcriptional regulator
MADHPTEQPEARASERHLRQMQKGSTEMLVLALLEERQRHGYELATLIGARSGGLLQMHAASLYPLLYRLERRGLVVGRWVEKPGERRRRFYRLTPDGREALAAHRRSWRDLFRALDQVARLDHA